MRNDELYAQAVVQELRPDLTLKFVSSQSHGEHDFDILDQGGRRIGVLEVTTLCDEQGVKETRLLYGEKKLSHVPRRLCANAWLVSIAERTPLKPIQGQLDALLFEAETRGLDSFSWEDESSSDLHERLEMLTGVGRASVHNDDAFHRLALEAYALWEDPHSVNEALVELLKRPDNERKLAQHSSLSERHLFVRVHLSAKKACQQLMCAESIPDSILPDYITNLWLVPTHIYTEDTLAVWHMCSGEGWERLTLANGFTPSR